jgi:hypothetical protein
MDGYSIVMGLASQPRWRVLLTLLGCFAGLCTLFALVATAITAWHEHLQSQWPEAAARIERCTVDPISFGRRDRYYIDCRLSFRVGIDEIAAEVDSRTTTTPEPVFDTWIAAHPQGTPLAVRYHPAHPAQVVAVDTDMPNYGPTTPQNLKALGAAAAVCVLLLTIAAVGWRPAASSSELE